MFSGTLICDYKYPISNPQATNKGRFGSSVSSNYDSVNDSMNFAIANSSTSDMPTEKCCFTILL